MVGTFIGIAILLSIGTLILGSSTNDCTILPNYDESQPSTNQTGWAAHCIQQGDQTISSYQLLGIVLVVLAAVIILAVVRHLAG